MARRRNRSRLSAFFQLFKKKKTENSFTNFSFNTISSLALQKEGKIRSYLKLLKIRVFALRGEKSFNAKSGRATAIASKVFGVTALLFSIVALCLVMRPSVIKDIIEGSRFAQVETVEFEGDYRQSESVLYRQTEIVRYQTSMFEVDVEEVAKKIELLSWVDRARVRRDWPSTVVIDIKKQVPVALVHTPDEQDEFHYINKKGILYRAVVYGDDLDYPVITGLEKLDVKQYQPVLAEVLLFLKKTAVNNPNLPLHAVSEIHIDMYGELTAYLVDTTFPIYFGKRNVKDAYKYLVRVLEDIYRKRSNGTSIANIGYIQLDYTKDQVLVTESGSG